MNTPTDITEIDYENIMLFEDLSWLEGFFAILFGCFWLAMNALVGNIPTKEDPEQEVATDHSNNSSNTRSTSNQNNHKPPWRLYTWQHLSLLCFIIKFSSSALY